MSFKQLLNRKVISLARYSTTSKINVTPNEEIINDLESKVVRLRDHPGICKPRNVTVPDTLLKALINVTEDQPLSQLVKTGKDLSRHLKGKVPPMEQAEVKETEKKAYDRVLSKHKNVEINNESDKERFMQMVRNKVKDILREKIYNWKPVDYDDYNSLVYLISRFAPEYAVLVRIFGEIHKRDENFRPKSFFDFGAGVGTAMWAANLYWKQYLFEYFNVDSSSSMNDLSQILLQGGRGNQVPLKGVFYRQFLPANNTTYDIVVSAYSLLELPSLEARLKTILNLWNKTEKYLVIVEQGTNAGFKVVNEIRDFILQVDKKYGTGHVFSPCPHDSICPRFTLDDGTPCNFEIKYMPLPFDGHPEAKRELFSYVVLKKGEKNSHDSEWPRVVRTPLIRSKHTICRMCTSNGDIREVIFTSKKHGKTTYHCARATKWGDLLPMTLENVDIDVEENKT
ncbi:unnamed protein product [Brassicogethes aeneus]|uniref:Methyltransferase-like protein 17, mitochondrial n=1 Tax=Brassicogethes aeneus TaxID=1431903 RepID=A0A9P0APZ0_BRAAE|nr:unnamed protein product [Brassicogethes aeneus]